MSKKHLLIIASSARPYAEAAVRSGFRVSVIDAFADEDVRALADQVIVVPITASGFDAKNLLLAVSQITQQKFHACLYGSGFEAQPALLEKLADMLPMHGNVPQVLRQVKSVDTFFVALDQFKIPYPKVYKIFPENSDQKFLVKSITSCGGQHIRHANMHAPLSPDEYLQEYIDGASISVLFLAESTVGENLTHVIGFNQQWAAPSHTEPFRFGGIASQAELTNTCKNKLCEIVRALSAHFQLVGLNSLDVVIADEEIYVLEINPRLSASVDLYAQDWLVNFDVDLLRLHLACCSNQSLGASTREKLSTLFQAPQPARAMQIVYAARDVSIKEAIDWPDWVKDRPAMQIKGQQKSLKILKENPICTVISQGNTALSAITTIKSRVNLILSML